MTPRIVIRPNAQRELDDHAEYIAQHSSQSARRFLAATQQAIGRLARLPGLGHRWESDNARLKDIRVSIIPRFKNYLIFYRIIPGGIEVIHVFHGAQDVSAILQSE